MSIKNFATYHALKDNIETTSNITTHKSMLQKVSCSRQHNHLGKQNKFFIN